MDFGRYLEPGRVLHLFCRFPHGIEKHKLLVLADNDEECLFFVVNSEINPFIEQRQHLRDQQIFLSSPDHDFLSHDSWLACHEAFPMARAEVLHQICENPDGCLREVIGDELKRKIIETVRRSLTLTSLDIQLIATSLSD
ncbi:MAG TPA: hypothetical protein VFH85_00200 [Gammaproteobacteria bacterium]|nr:hypothetical protein [Gammaproteobacteria bacterium]